MSDPQPSGRINLDAERHQALLRLDGRPIQGDLTDYQRQQIAKKGLNYRRVSRYALAAKVRAVIGAIDSGDRRLAVAALEDLAGAALAMAHWIQRHGLHEGRTHRATTTITIQQTNDPPALPEVPSNQRVYWLERAYCVEALTPVAIVARALYLRVHHPNITPNAVADVLGISPDQPRRWAQKAGLE